MRGPGHVLVLCTANQCRSPIAAAFLRGRLPATTTVRSAGFLHGGEAVPPIGVKLMAKRGIDLSKHRSATVVQADLEAADLVLGMEVRHVREVAGLVSAAADRAFTLKEFVRLADAIGPPRSSLDAWLAELSRGRQPGDLFRRGDEDSVRDPVGASTWVWKSVIDELDALTRAAAGLMT